MEKLDLSNTAKNEAVLVVRTAVTKWEFANQFAAEREIKILITRLS